MFYDKLMIVNYTKVFREKKLLLMKSKLQFALVYIMKDLT